MYLQPIDPECRKFLKCLKTAQTKSKKISVEFSEMEKLMDMERSDIIRIAAFLEEMRIIVIDCYDTGGFAGFHTTQLGRFYNRYRWYDFKKTALFSILLPLIISAVSGALTALLTLLLQGR